MSPRPNFLTSPGAWIRSARIDQTPADYASPIEVYTSRVRMWEAVAGVLLARASRDLGLDIVGAHGMLTGDDAPHAGAVPQMALSSVVHGIQGGAEQIQRNILGERVLGLPPDPRLDKGIPFSELRAKEKEGATA